MDVLQSENAIKQTETTVKEISEGTESTSVKMAVSAETFVFLAVASLFFGTAGSVMGAVNMVNTIMNTAYDLLITTCFYLLAITVVAGALSEMLSEFGVISLLNKMLAPVMMPLFGLPGASVVGVFATYFSDNPAILPLAGNQQFRKYFKKYQIPALTNLGTSFGMGLIVLAFMARIPAPEGESFFTAALIGTLGAVVGAAVSTRLMLLFTSRLFGRTESENFAVEDGLDIINFRVTRRGSAGTRALEAMLEGGKAGVDVGMSIIPGVLVICTVIMLLSNGAPEGGFTGGAYEGIGLLPLIGEKLRFIIAPLFGFSAPSGILIPITAMGSAAGALSLIPNMVSGGLAHSNDIAVFTAICMCWSGYLSTHIAMMQALGYRQLIGKAIFCHTIGGIVAGIAANWLYRLFISML